MALSFPINNVRSFFQLSEKLSILQDPDSCFSHSLIPLNSRINQIGEGNQVDSHLRRVWQIFYASICAERTPETMETAIVTFRELKKFYPPARNLGVFNNTDLLVYPDTDEGPIPINGIKETSFRDM